ncbi:hypothetical protein [Rosistilla oblonga]|uniref:hypothetical protein n=1 Tax=Rosistilla oblonga TaxID=2527990 RepID=UPI003A9738DD
MPWNTIKKEDDRPPLEYQLEKVVRVTTIAADDTDDDAARERRTINSRQTTESSLKSARNTETLVLDANRR